MYGKPTATDTTSINPQDSCHPTEKKLSAIRYLKNINETYILKDNSKQRERERKIIDHILRNNIYDTSILNKRKSIKMEKDTNTQNKK
jgi:hypothetical protein